jgi:hypothetical protein
MGNSKLDLLASAENSICLYGTFPWELNFTCCHSLSELSRRCPLKIYHGTVYHGIGWDYHNLLLLTKPHIVADCEDHRFVISQLKC